ncbi:MAG: putative PEP-binding protein [Acholeplasma sp.]|nr:putative PEP-binding protein [Acholeplasma sp.]
MILEIISKGIAYGRAFMPQNQAQNELNNKQQIDDILDSVIEELTSLLKDTKDNHEIILFQIAVLQDQALIGDIKNRLKQTNAIKTAFDQAMHVYIEDLSKQEDPYFKERVVDLKDIKARVERSVNQSEKKPEGEIILCVEELFPSLLFEYQNNIKGILALKGSGLSHGAILCRERNIPYMIVDTFSFDANEWLLMDSSQGKLMVNPNKQTVNQALEVKISSNQALLTKHHPNKLYLNYSGVSNMDPIFVNNSDGIGLYRSEFLYYELNRFPSIEEQTKVYEALLERFYPKPVVIRTYDFGEDKTPTGMKIETRGVSSYILHFKNDFINQLTALLIAHHKYDNLRIMIPMVFQKDDLEVFKKITEGVKKSINLSGKLPKIGVMIETKEAYESLDDFRKADFVSIGTNDLGNSLFGFNRNDKIDRQDYLEQLCEAVYNVTTFFKDKQIPCTICGDIASQRDGFEALLKQGESNFSVAMPFLKEAKKIINQNK